MPEYILSKYSLISIENFPYQTFSENLYKLPQNCHEKSINLDLKSKVCVPLSITADI